jgi:hypothetical protein
MEEKILSSNSPTRSIKDTSRRAISLNAFQFIPTNIDVITATKQKIEEMRSVKKGQTPTLSTVVC